MLNFCSLTHYGEMSIEFCESLDLEKGFCVGRIISAIASISLLLAVIYTYHSMPFPIFLIL